LTLKGSYGTAKVSGGQISVGPAGAAATNLPVVRNFEDGAKQRQIAIGAVYDLSKRTAVYGSYSTLTTTGLNTFSSMGPGSAYNDQVGQSKTSTGLDLGVLTASDEMWA